MKLIYLDKELDTSKEHELFAPEGKTFNVDIAYTDECFYTDEVAELRTEVHHLYENFGIMGGERIAFESDILCTGFTRDISEIEEVKITLIDIPND